MPLDRNAGLATGLGHDGAVSGTGDGIIGGLNQERRGAGGIDMALDRPFPAFLRGRMAADQAAPGGGVIIGWSIVMTG